MGNNIAFIKSYTKFVSSFNHEKDRSIVLENYLGFVEILKLNHGEEEGEKLLHILREDKDGFIDMAENLNVLFKLQDEEKEIDTYAKQFDDESIR